MEDFEEMPTKPIENPWSSIFSFGSQPTQKLPNEPHRPLPGIPCYDASQLQYYSQVPSSFSFGLLSNESHNVNQDWYSIKLGKRKNPDPLPLSHINKQHITETKMAEYMSNLHISSESEPTRLEPESVKNKRLYMCEEMRKLQTDSIIQSCLISPIEKPCTALVVWQPPERILPIIGEQSNINTKSNDNTNKDDNNEDEDAEIVSYFPEAVLNQIDTDAVDTMDLDS